VIAVDFKLRTSCERLELRIQHGTVSLRTL